MKFILMMLVAWMAIPAFAVEEIEVSEEVQAHVLDGYFPIALEKGDLNGDGKEDCILVLNKDEEDSEADRPMMILIRSSAGKLVMAKRNDKVVYCEGCGGMMGDPFEGVQIEGNAFTVMHYGGSAWRWSNSFKFAYSRKDNTWQLVKVDGISFHAFEPDKRQITVHTPPRDYGKIDIADFDPENYLGKGPK